MLLVEETRLLVVEVLGLVLAARPEALLLYETFEIELSHAGVVELQPALRTQRVAQVVTCFGSTHVNHYTDQVVLEFFVCEVGRLLRVGLLFLRLFFRFLNTWLLFLFFFFLFFLLLLFDRHFLCFFFPFFPNQGFILFDYLVEHVLAHVEFFGKFKPIIYLNVAQSIHIENNPIQVHNQRIRQPLNHRLLRNLDLFLTRLALIVGYYLPACDLRQTVVNIFLVLNLD